MTKREITERYEREREKLNALKGNCDTKEGQLAFLAQYDITMQVLNDLAAYEWGNMKKKEVC